jgi:4'-phosphopantetheinyl transferase
MPVWPVPGEVHVWSIDLDRPDAEVAVLGGMLTADELLRAGKLRAGQHARRRFVASRAGLRALLGAYLDLAPAEVGFAASVHGKPRLDSGSPLRFNLSHSGGRALVAVADGAEVGADVEEVRPRADLRRVARRVFTEAEREAIEAAAADDRDRAFYRHWVAKEAFVKATGRGISSVRSFEVLLEAPGGARLVHVGGDFEEAAGWTLAPLAPLASGYEAAVVAEGPGATIRAAATFDPLAPG